MVMAIYVYAVNIKMYELKAHNHAFVLSNLIHDFRDLSTFTQKLSDCLYYQKEHASGFREKRVWT